MGRVTTSTPDLWHHYGCARATSDRAVPHTFYWSWGQDAGPGPEVLGDLTGRCAGDLGAGAARHAAHLAVHHQPARVVAVDASPAQHAMATDLYARLAPRLRIVQSGAVPHLQAMTGTYDVLYSVFGAVDFTDPRELLPAAAAALKPGGRLVFATLAHYLSGAPAQPDAVAAESRQRHRTAKPPQCAAGSSKSMCGPSCSTRPDSPTSLPTCCLRPPAGRTPPTHCWWARTTRPRTGPAPPATWS
jgi:SAM-dependent methyltransferase